MINKLKKYIIAFSILGIISNNQISPIDSGTISGICISIIGIGTVTGTAIGIVTLEDSLKEFCHDHKHEAISGMAMLSFLGSFLLALLTDSILSKYTPTHKFSKAQENLIKKINKHPIFSNTPIDCFNESEFMEVINKIYGKNKAKAISDLRNISNLIKKIQPALAKAKADSGLRNNKVNNMENELKQYYKFILDKITLLKSFIIVESSKSQADLKPLNI